MFDIDYTKGMSPTTLSVLDFFVTTALIGSIFALISILTTPLVAGILVGGAAIAVGVDSYKRSAIEREEREQQAKKAEASMLAVLRAEKNLPPSIKQAFQPAVHGPQDVANLLSVICQPKSGKALNA